MTDTPNPEMLSPEKIEQTSQGYVETLEAFREWFYQDPKFAIGTLAILLLGWICKKIIDDFPAIYSKFTLWRIERFSNWDFDSRYRQHIIFEHRVFNVRGLRTQGTFTLEVEKVYVGLKIAPSANPNKASSITHNEALAGNRPIWDFCSKV